MPGRRSPLIHFAFSVILTFCIINLFNIQGHKSIIFSGISSALEESSGIIKGLGRFLNSLKAMIDIVSYVIDLSVLLLLLAISLISTGLSILGIPRGKFSFLLSLGIADLFWFTWIKSFNPEHSVPAVISAMIKPNLVLIIPFFIIYLLRTSAVSDKLIPKIKSSFKSLFKKKRQYPFKKDEIMRMMNRALESYTGFHNSFFNDIMKQKDDKDFVFSEETIKRKKEIEDILKKINMPPPEAG